MAQEGMMHPSHMAERRKLRDGEYETSITNLMNARDRHILYACHAFWFQYLLAQFRIQKNVPVVVYMKGVHCMCPIPFLSPFMEIIRGFFINLYLHSCVLNKLEQHDLINRILSKVLDHLWLFWSACILEMIVLSVLF